MNEQARSIALVVAGLAFIAFLVLRLLVPLGGGNATRHGAGLRLADARRRARAPGTSPVARALALREAAAIALDELQRPGLAASYALRAERLDPEDAQAVGLLAIALRRATRYHALERLLWRRIAKSDAGAAGHVRALEELIGLYDGPLRRPEVAEGLRRMTTKALATDDAASV
ncbi:MAG: hypothetical protein ACHQ53_06110 [Polyangiales bacterium]